MAEGFNWDAYYNLYYLFNLNSTRPVAVSELGDGFLFARVRTLCSKVCPCEHKPTFELHGRTPC